MVRKLFVMAISAAFLAASYSSAMSAETKDAKAQPMVVKAPAMAQAAVNKPAAKINRGNFNMAGGKITKIDSADPANIKVDVYNEADKTTKTFTIVPQTTITKVTDASELKTGDTVRVMSRKINDKEVAMGVMFGKIKFNPKPVQALEGAAAPTPVKPKAPAAAPAKK